MQWVLAAEDFRASIWSRVFGKIDAETYLAAVTRWFGAYNKLIAGKEYFTGSFSIGDICIYEVVNTAVTKFPDTSMDEFPDLKAHWERIGARPKIAAYQAAKTA